MYANEVSIGWESDWNIFDIEDVHDRSITQAFLASLLRNFPYVTTYNIQFICTCVPASLADHSGEQNKCIVASLAGGL